MRFNGVFSKKISSLIFLGLVIVGVQSKADSYIGEFYQSRSEEVIRRASEDMRSLSGAALLSALKSDLKLKIESTNESILQAQQKQTRLKRQFSFTPPESRQIISLRLMLVENAISKLVILRNEMSLDWKAISFRLSNGI